ncbi:MAG: hypothetical protein ACKVQK_25840 [Burkholderiales bacterium]
MKAVPTRASKSPVLPNDPDMRGALAALRRAAAQARELSERTGTPFYVMENGRIVDLNAGALRPSRGKSTLQTEHDVGVLHASEPLTTGETPEAINSVRKKRHIKQTRG